LDKYGLLKHVIEEKTERTGRRERRRKQLLDNLKEKRKYWNLKEGLIDRTVWRTRLEEAVDLLQGRIFCQ